MTGGVTHAGESLVTLTPRNKHNYKWVPISAGQQVLGGLMVTDGNV